jgi:hypothetical protein
MPGQRHDLTWWRKTIADFTASGLSRQDFAKHRGVHPESIRQWHRKLRDASVPALVRVELPQATPAVSSAVLEIVVGPAELRFVVGTDTTYVGALVAAIARAVPC